MNLWADAPGVTVVDDPMARVYPLAADAAGKDDVFVGRIRLDLGRPNALLVLVRQRQPPQGGGHQCRANRRKTSGARSGRGLSVIDSPTAVGPMRNIKLTLCYDGTDFHGWQRQPGLRTVQQALEEALETADGRPPDRDGQRPHRRRRPRAGPIGALLHRLTPLDGDLRPCPERLDAPRRPRARRSRRASSLPRNPGCEVQAVSLRDRQRPDRQPVPTPIFLARTPAARCGLDAPRRAACWAGMTSGASRPNGPIARAASGRSRISRSYAKGEIVTIEVEADGFLYNMVRSITGTLMLVGTGKRREAWVAEVLAAESRVEAGPTAPPQGLFLVRVRYGSEERCESSTSLLG